MSFETDIATLINIPAITALLTGGIYTAGTLSPEGITPVATPAAFDANSFLLPMAVVKQRGLIPTRQVVDYENGAHSFNQIVEIWLYQRIDYAILDTVVVLIFHTLHGIQIDETFEVDLVNILDRQRDTGVLQEASLIRMDFSISGVMQMVD